MTTPKAMLTEAELDAFEWHADGANRPIISRESLKRLIAAARAHLSASGEEQKEDEDGKAHLAGRGDVGPVGMVATIGNLEPQGSSAKPSSADVAPLPGDGGEDEDGYSFDVEQLRRNLKSRDDYLVMLGVFGDYADWLRSPSPQGNVVERGAENPSGAQEMVAGRTPDIAGVKEKLQRIATADRMEFGGYSTDTAAEALRVIEGMEEVGKYAEMAANHHFEEYAKLEDELTAAREAVDVKNDAVIRLKEALYISCEKLNEAQAEIERLRGALEKIANINRYDGYASIARAALTTERDG
jgi:hypothetical protein